MSYLIPDDPIIRCMERTGYPPWIDDDYEEEEEEMVKYGYGVNLEKEGELLCEDAYQKLTELAISKCENLKEEFDEYMEINGSEFDTPDEAKRCFCEDFEDDYFEGSGFGALLAVVINELECGGATRFLYGDRCIFVEESIPYDAYGKEKMLTVLDINRILRKYFSPFTKDRSFTPEYLEINW